MIKSQIKRGIEPDSMSRLQEAKVKYLLDKGGKIDSVIVFVKLNDGSVMAVDQFGRCVCDRN